MGADIAAIIAALSGLAGVVVTQGLLWLTKRRQRQEHASEAELDDQREFRRDLIGVFDSLLARYEERAEDYYRLKSEHGTLRMERDLCRTKYEDLTDRYARIAAEVNDHRIRLDAIARCLNTCDHTEECELVQGG